MKNNSLNKQIQKNTINLLPHLQYAIYKFCFCHIRCFLDIN